jgi:formamidopyrimidine-DNA glycosylase
MPELPEVETTVRGLAPLLDGRRIAAVEVRRPDLRRPFPVDLRQRLTGARVTGLSRRAKYGLIATDRDDSMIFHLGMSGRWRTNAQDIETHDHLRIQTEEGVWLALNDARRFGSVDLVTGDPETAFAPFRALGPEPLSDAFDARYLAGRVATRAAPMKQLLLDQQVVAGLGNIYVCEALFMSGIAPTRAGAKVPKAKFAVLTDAIKQVLERAIAAGGSSLRDFIRPDGELGYFSHEWLVYGREGEGCRTCGTPIARMTQGGRSSFYCPKCQR